MIYIGIHGPKRIGKDTFAKNLKQAFMDVGEPRVAIGRIADPLYNWAADITGWMVDDLMGSRKDDKWNTGNAPIPSLAGHSPRDMLLDLGLFVRDKYGEAFMVQALKRDYNKNRFCRIVLVVDVRTNVEAEAMDFVFDLERDGCVYAGGRTESNLTTGVLRKLTLKTCEDTTQAIDFKALADSLEKESWNLEALKKESL